MEQNPSWETNSRLANQRFSANVDTYPELYDSIPQIPSLFF